MGNIRSRETPRHDPKKIYEDVQNLRDTTPKKKQKLAIKVPKQRNLDLAEYDLPEDILLKITENLSIDDLLVLKKMSKLGNVMISKKQLTYGYIKKKYGVRNIWELTNQPERIMRALKNLHNLTRVLYTSDDFQEYFKGTKTLSVDDDAQWSLIHGPLTTFKLADERKGDVSSAISAEVQEILEVFKLNHLTTEFLNVLYWSKVPASETDTQKFTKAMIFVLIMANASPEFLQFINTSGNSPSNLLASLMSDLKNYYY